MFLFFCFCFSELTGPDPPDKLFCGVNPFSWLYCHETVPFPLQTSNKPSINQNTREHFVSRVSGLFIVSYDACINNIITVASRYKMNSDHSAHDPNKNITNIPCRMIIKVLLYNGWCTKIVKMADLQAHNAYHCDALWACRSAIFTF